MTKPDRATRDRLKAEAARIQEQRAFDALPERERAIINHVREHIAATRDGAIATVNIAWASGPALTVAIKKGGHYWQKSLPLSLFEQDIEAATALLLGDKREAA